MRIPTPEDFARQISEAIQNEMDDKKLTKPIIVYGTIDPNYESGNPCIIFDGEEDPTPRQYNYLSPYIPVAQDRIALIRTAVESDEYLILGKVM